MCQTTPVMTRNGSSSSQTILLAIIVIITFPIWIGLFGALFGVAAGIFGAAIGIVGGIFGAIFGLIALPFKLLFGWGHWDWGCGWFGHHHGFGLIALIIVLALIFRNRIQR